MGLLDSVIGAIAGGQGGAGQQGGGQSALINIVMGMLANKAGATQGGGAAAGGLGDLMARFQQGGLGDVLGSWIGTGQNLPVSSDQLSNVLGSDMLAKIAQQLGVSNGEAASQLSEPSTLLSWSPETGRFWPVPIHDPSTSPRPPC